tara:strand:- start:24690 stop:25949 length:1260 start_codon:yes stop_codon:yes gene_type:complete
MEAKFPSKLKPLFLPKRYKILYGGRGGAKSWGAARALLLLAAKKPLRVLCAREIQHSISESVHQLLKDQIESLGLSHFYEINNNEIRGMNGTLIMFAGLKHNIGNIKSKEGIDIVWVEEAQTVSKNSWETLIPTIRKEGSEIWVTFNPGMEEDETFQRFVANPPQEALVIKINWNDNKWFPEVLRKEKDELKEKDFKAYLNIWEGECKQTVEGAIYADEMREAMEQGRIGNVPYDATKPVDVFFDLGWADNTSMWFAQIIGHEFRIIDFTQNQFKKTPFYTKLMQDKGYTYGRIYLPHDANNENINQERTTYQIIREAFPNASVDVLENFSGAIKAGIEAVRNIFPLCYFDKEKCADGLQALRHYKYNIDENGKSTMHPEHDWSSHAADAFRYLAMSLKKKQEYTYQVPNLFDQYGNPI